jgi:prolyl-tRNA synthetase
MCSGCGYAANVEIAQGVPVAPAFPAAGVEEVATPNVRAIAEVSAFLKIDPCLTIKSLLYVGQRSGPVLALVRGDHALHERKLARALQGDEVRPASAEEIRQHLGRGPARWDPSVRACRSGRRAPARRRVRGRSQPGGRPPARGRARTGFRSPLRGSAHGGRRRGVRALRKPLSVEKVIEIGNIFKLGTKFSVALDAKYLDESGKEQPS